VQINSDGGDFIRKITRCLIKCVCWSHESQFGTQLRARKELISTRHWIIAGSAAVSFTRGFYTAYFIIDRGASGGLPVLNLTLK